MPALSPIGLVNEQFFTRIKPELNSWGLSQHPNPASYFGTSEHGYRYDFADMSDPTNVRLATFAILRPTESLWIKGYRVGNIQNDGKDLLLLFDSVKDIFTLSRRWSIRNPFNVRFELRPKKGKPLIEAAARLCDEVIEETPRLKGYLYG